MTVTFDDLSKQQKYRVRLWREGRCVQCRRDRGDSPYLRLCVKCREKERRKERKKCGYGKKKAGERGRPPLRPDGSS